MDESKIVILNDNEIGFKPIYINNIYGFKINYDDKETAVHCEIALKFHKYSNKNEMIFSIDRKQVYLNNQLPDSQVYEIADQMSRSVYPIIFSYDKNNSLVKIENHENIIQRCLKIKRKIENYYKGQFVEKMIENYKKSYSDITLLKENLSNDLFMKLIFFPVHKKYDNELKASTDYSFAFNFRNIIDYEISHEIVKSYDASGKMEINLKSTDEMFKAAYKLYPEDHAVFSIKGNLTAAEGGNIQFEIYHLNVENRNTKKVSLLADSEDRGLNFNEKKRKVYIGETEELPKIKRNFWRFLD